MFIHSIKSKTRKRYASAQTINQTKCPLNSSLSGKTKTVFNLHVVQPSSRMHQFLAVLAAVLLFVSCKKEELSNPVLNSTTSDALSASAGSNAPKVDAGPALRIVYPTASATLSGSGLAASGTVTFRWKQVSGNSTATIDKPTNASTSVSNLKPGLYKFVLKATDSNGTSSTDTTTISVFQKLTWTIEGVTREALVHPPTGGSGAAAPIIIAFHGHTGTDFGFSEKAFELSWPEAVVVYAQGLPTKSATDKQGRKPGWQNSVGEINTRTGVQDQDLKYFAAMLPTLRRKYNADLSLVFVHGWSNGAEFIYNVLWAARPNKLAALSPAGASLGTISGKQPIPVIHTAGTQDEDVSFSRQERTVQQVRNLDECSPVGTTWVTGPSELLGTHYASPIKASVVMLQYNGDHSYPFTVPPIIVKFFKEVAGQ